MIIRRKLTLCAGACAAAILAAEFFGSAAALGLGAAGIAFAVKAAGGSGRTAWILLALYLCSLGHMLILSGQADSFPDPEERVTLRGEVLQKEPRRDGGYWMVLRAEEANRRAIDGEKVMIAWRERSRSTDEEAESSSDCPLPGQRIRVTGKLQLPQPRRNPGGFDQTMYLRGKGIRRVMTAENLSAATGAASPLTVWLFRGKERFIEGLRRHTDSRTAEVMQAVLFGEEGCLDEDLTETFQKNGTAHILAVSGLHIGILYAAMLRLRLLLTGLFVLRTGPVRDALFYSLAGLFFLGYTVLAGCSPSVVRAVLMILLHMFARMTGRRYDLCCAALAVGLASIAVNPYTLFLPGFQMSFLAVFSLSLFLPLISRWYTGILMAGLAVQLGLGPYILWQFGWISWIAVFINIPVVMAAGLLVPLGMGSLCLTVLFAGLPDHITDLMDQTAGLLCDLLIRLNAVCCADRVTYLTLAAPPVALVFLYYLCLFVFASESGRLLVIRREYGKIAAAAICVLLVSCAAAGAADDGFRRMDLVFVDVGQGDCMHIRTGGNHYLIDSGGNENYAVGKKTVKPYLLRNGVSRVDGAFVTHLHTDHYQGICELAREGMIRRLFLAEVNRRREREICAQTGLPPERITYLRAGQRLRLSKNAVLDVVWPTVTDDPLGTPGDGTADEDENASSLIMKITINGVSLLATGDLGEEGEQQLMKLYRNQGGSPLHADILKVGHHGSRYSTGAAFAETVAPSAAVIQVAVRNVYGHPTRETLNRLSHLGIPVFRTDRQGAIGMKLRDGKVRKVKTMIDASQ